MTQEEQKLIHGLLDKINKVVSVWNSDVSTFYPIDVPICDMIKYMTDNKIGKVFDYKPPKQFHTLKL